MPENGDLNQNPHETRDNDEALVYAFPARVMQRAARTPKHEELMALAQAHALDEDAFNDTPPYFFSAQISNSSTDAYFTHMLPSTLRNFANEANEGRAFLEGHNTRSRPLGYSLQGRFVGASAAGKQRVEADFFIAPEPSGMGRKCEMIHEIRTGTARDVSVGFNLGEDGMYVCDLCKRDYMGGECPHMLGTKWNWDKMAYVEETICTAGIDNGHLNEVSSVYDGATPGAAILKAIRAMEEGRMTPELARVLEPMYRMKLPAARHVWAGVGVPKAIGDGDRYANSAGIVSTSNATAGQIVFGSNSTDDQMLVLGSATVTPTVGLNISTPDANSFRRSQGQIAEEIARQLSLARKREEGSMPDQETTRTTEVGQEPPNPPAAPPTEPEPRSSAQADPPVFTAPRADPSSEERAIAPAEWTAEQYEQCVCRVMAGAETPAEQLAECVRRLVSEVTELRPAAVDGRAYRAALVDDVLLQAGRAFGQAYDEEQERAVCAPLSTTQLISLRNRYKAAADALFTVGRVTSDTYEPEPPPAEPVRVPAAAYRG